MPVRLLLLVLVGGCARLATVPDAGPPAESSKVVGTDAGPPTAVSNAGLPVEPAAHEALGGLRFGDYVAMNSMRLTLADGGWLTGMLEGEVTVRAREQTETFPHSGLNVVEVRPRPAFVIVRLNDGRTLKGEVVQPALTFRSRAGTFVVPLAVLESASFGVVEAIPSKALDRPPLPPPPRAWKCSDITTVSPVTARHASQPVFGVFFRAGAPLVVASEPGAEADLEPIRRRVAACKRTAKTLTATSVTVDDYVVTDDWDEPGYVVSATELAVGGGRAR